MSLPSDPPERPTEAANQVRPDAPLESKTAPSPSSFAHGETVVFRAADSVVPEASDSASDLPLPTAFGRYEVRERIASGGFGEVYLGHDPQLNRTVAIKVPKQQGSREQREAFLQEARRAAQLRHPGILTIYDVGVADDHCYIICDYLRGVTLNQWLREHSLTWKQAAEITAAVADALAHAHAQRTVHRDIKPENIMLINGLTPVLVDFGLALNESDLREDQQGHVAGTAPYMSPEQVRGEAHRIDGRTDIYSLGVVLYRLLCGRFPFFDDDSSRLFHQILHDPPPPPRQWAPAIPPRLEAVCLKALAKEPSARYATAAEMASDLRALLADAARAPGELVDAIAPRDTRGGHTTQAGRASMHHTKRVVREPERRQVTVLLLRFELDSALAEEPLDIEAQDELVRQLRDMCVSVVRQYDGTPVVSAGEELLVCFGFPVAFEDAAQRAVRTGWEILERLTVQNDEWRRQHGATFELWLTIHTGPVVVGDAVSPTDSNISLVGEAPLVATRLSPHVPSQAVVVTQTTERLVRGVMACESLGSRPVKGVAEPIELFRVTEVRQAHTRLETMSSNRLEQLVGREHEARLLRHHWEESRAGRGQIVLLQGEAGLGKSRLVVDLRQGVEGESNAPAPVVIEWRCLPYYQSTGLYPVIEWLQRLLEIGRDEPHAQRLDKLQACLQQHGMEARGDVVPLLASLLSIEVGDRYPPLNLSPAGQKQRTNDLLIHWLRNKAAQQPVLLIIEDLHWADPSTLELLELMTESWSGLRAMALLSGRPEFTPPWPDRSNQSRIVIARLQREHVAELMRIQCGGQELPSALVDQMFERTGGIPLYVEEYTKMLFESGGLRLSAGRVEQTESFSLTAIPASLQDLLVARLDRMASIPDVIQLGATLGRDFSYELIRAASELGEAELRAELDKLVTGEILVQRGRLPRSTFQFKHALLQEAAYQTLIKKKRLRFHQRAAEVLEQQFVEAAETRPEIVAHHWTEANVPERAIPSWLKAGLRSQRRSANREAIQQFSRGLEVLETLPPGPRRDQQELEFRVPLGVVLMAARGYAAPEVGDCFGRARRLCESLHEKLRLFFVLRGMWTWHLLRDELDTCSQLCDEMLDLAEGLPESRELLAEAHFLPGNTHYYRGDFVRSLRHLELGWEAFDLERSKALALRTGLNCGVTILCHLALADWQFGNFDQAFRGIERAMALSDELAHPFSRAFALYHRRRLLQYCRLTDDVAASVEAELALAREQGFLFREAQALMCRGACLIRRGQVAEGLTQIKQGESIYESSGARLSLTHHHCYIAETCLEMGRTDLAQAAYDKAQAIQQSSTERYLAAELQRLRGELLVARGPGHDEEAERAFAEGLTIARNQQSRARELRIALSWARWKVRQGECEMVRERLAPLLASFHSGHDLPDLVEARQLLDEPRRKGQI